MRQPLRPPFFSCTSCTALCSAIACHAPAACHDPPHSLVFSCFHCFTIRHSYHRRRTSIRRSLVSTLHSCFLRFAGRAPAPSTEQVLSRCDLACVDESVCRLVCALSVCKILAQSACCHALLSASRPHLPHLWGYPCVSAPYLTRADAPSRAPLRTPVTQAGASEPPRCRRRPPMESGRRGTTVRVSQRLGRPRAMHEGRAGWRPLNAPIPRESDRGDGRGGRRWARRSRWAASCPRMAAPGPCCTR